MPPNQTPVLVMVDHNLLTQLALQLAENTKALTLINDQLGNTRFYEGDAADYLGVQKCTMYDYRERGLPYEKVGRIVSYRRKDLDEWRTKSRTKIVVSR